MPSIAIVHHHLKKGGITRVIENALAALSGYDDLNIVVLSGEAPAEKVNIPNVRVIEALRYANDAPSTPPEALAEHMISEAKKGLNGQKPDLFHIHNHSLGKNPTVTAAVSLLHKKGYRLLLQLHDFAEDGRPQNYARLREQLADELDTTLYPCGEGILYATLNARDRHILQEAAGEHAKVETLPNAIALPELSGDAEGIRKQFGERQIILYPTRAIRRKNVGEFLLWATLRREEAHFVTTLAPENLEWQEIHYQWEKLALELQLPVTFAAVSKGPYSFDDWMLSADEIITTSIAEGFGLAFLEPSLIKKPIVGRNLPEITEDFNKVPLSHLYQRLYVPLSAEQKTTLQTKLTSGLREVYTHYGVDLPSQAVDEALGAISDDQGRIDFAYLDEELQAEIIQQVHAGSLKPEDFSPSQLEKPTEADLQQANQVVRENYSLQAYGERLHKLYSQLVAENVGRTGSIPADKVLKGFLHPRRFCLLRS